MMHWGEAKVKLCSPKNSGHGPNTDLTDATGIDPRKGMHVAGTNANCAQWTASLHTKSMLFTLPHINVPTEIKYPIFFYVMRNIRI
jgi:hypothetical protein